MLAKKDKPVLAFKTVPELEAYLSRQPTVSKGFWIKLSKTGAPEPTIGKAEVIEAALCYGWIDGQINKFDQFYFLVLMTPRRPASRWSLKNRETADRLAKQGRLRPGGLAQIEAAKADGRWKAAYASQAKAQVPKDLAAALLLDEAAKQFFESLDSANRYAVIYRVNDAKRPETRASRVAKFVQMLARGETLHPRRRRIREVAARTDRKKKK